MQLLKLADKGIEALKEDAGFMKGLNTYKGYFTCKPVAQALNGKYKEVEELL